MKEAAVVEARERVRDRVDAQGRDLVVRQEARLLQLAEPAVELVEKRVWSETGAPSAPSIFSNARSTRAQSARHVVHGDRHADPLDEEQAKELGARDALARAAELPLEALAREAAGAPEASQPEYPGGEIFFGQHFFRRGAGPEAALREPAVALRARAIPPRARRPRRLSPTGKTSMSWPPWRRSTSSLSVACPEDVSGPRRGGAHRRRPGRDGSSRRSVSTTRRTSARPNPAARSRPATRSRTTSRTNSGAAIRSRRRSRETARGTRAGPSDRAAARRARSAAKPARSRTRPKDPAIEFHACIFELYPYPERKETSGSVFPTRAATLSPRFSFRGVHSRVSRACGRADPDRSLPHRRPRPDQEGRAGPRGTSAKMEAKNENVSSLVYARVKSDYEKRAANSRAGRSHSRRRPFVSTSASKSYASRSSAPSRSRSRRKSSNSEATSGNFPKANSRNVSPTARNISPKTDRISRPCFR